MSQNKQVLLNYEEGSIVIEPATKGYFATKDSCEVTYETVAYNIVGGGYGLGRYKTLERAKAILQDIFTQYMKETKYEMPEE
jgi:hypothetical protein